MNPAKPDPIRPNRATCPTCPIWLADWSDGEHADFLTACSEAGVRAEVLRTAALGSTVGSRLHRLRSWPAYIALAARGLARSGRGRRPLIAWQPLAGAVAALLAAALPARRRPPLVVLNPLVNPDLDGPKQRLVNAATARADRVLVFSRRAIDVAAEMGIEPRRLGFVPLGVRAPAAPAAAPPPPGRYLLAAGRDGRDWQTLARATRGLGVEVKVIGPPSLPADAAHLTLLPQVNRDRYRQLTEGAAAVVVPLLWPRRTTGQLTILDAMAAGRAVIATRASGTEDYVTAETGALVAPGDAAALRATIGQVMQPGVAARLGAAALAAARGPFSLSRFVAAVDAEARRQ